MADNKSNATRLASVYPLDQDNISRLPQRVIMGVDFGTVYSKLSYALISDSHTPSFFNEDPTSPIANYAAATRATSVPTKMIYHLGRHSRDPNSPISEQDLENTSDNVGSEGRLANNTGSGSHDEDLDMGTETDNLYEFDWGHRAEEHWRLPATHSDPDNAPLSRLKSLLDDGSETEEVRKGLINQLDKIKRRGVIQQNLEVIVDYLTCLLRHALSELRKKGIDDSYRKEVVICVPVTWKEKARADMYACLVKALRKAESDVDVQKNRIENLHIESELDAAAAHVLATQSIIKHGENFVLLDTGGGIVQAKTYRVDGKPFLLGQGIVPPGAGFHGSSFLDEDFRNYMERLLAEETYLEQDVVTINWLVEEAMFRFQESAKPNFHCNQEIKRQFYIPGLRDNEKKGFKKACVYVDRCDITKMFTKQLDAIFEIVQSQLNDARDLGYKVEKVVLIGGFGRSQFLIDDLTGRLARYGQEKGSQVALFPLEESAGPNIVSSGAIFLTIHQLLGARGKDASSFDQSAYQSRSLEE